MQTHHREVLVLNRNWQPINILSLSDALGKVVNEKARIIDPLDGFVPKTWEEWAKLHPTTGEDVIRSFRQVFRCPEVIVVNKYNKVHRGKMAFSRHNLYVRDDFQCQYCGCRPGSAELSVDHVIPKSRSGVSSWENCVLACVQCNVRKSAKLLSETTMKLIRQPAMPPFHGFKTSSLRCKTWMQFIDASYWLIPLEN